MSTKEKLTELIETNFNLQGFADGIIDEVLEPALRKVVEDSKNPFDDMAFAAVYPVLEVELKKQIAELISKIYR
jgi:hypothetical protein